VDRMIVRHLCHVLVHPVMREHIVKLICIHCALVVVVFWQQYSFFSLFLLCAVIAFLYIRRQRAANRDLLPSSVKDAAAPIFDKVVRGVTNAKTAAGNRIRSTYTSSASMDVSRRNILNESQQQQAMEHHHNGNEKDWKGTVASDSFVNPLYSPTDAKRQMLDETMVVGQYPIIPTRDTDSGISGGSSSTRA